MSPWSAKPKLSKSFLNGFAEDGVLEFFPIALCLMLRTWAETRGRCPKPGVTTVAPMHRMEGETPIRPGEMEARVRPRAHGTVRSHTDPSCS